MDNLIISLILVIGRMYLYYLHHQPEYTGDYNEDNLPNPQTEYGKQKVEVEKFIKKSFFSDMLNFGWD